MVEDQSNSNDRQTEAGTPGLMHLLPMRLDIALNVSAMTAVLSPWQSPLAMGLVGTTRDQDSIPQILFSYEWPIPYLDVVASLSKPELEGLHLSRYMTDFLLGTGALPYSEVVPGDDPPDFVGRHEGSTVGIECTSFAIAQRRASNGLFEGVRGAILREDRSGFAHLHGTVVYMWFLGKDGRHPLPPRVGSVDEIGDVIASLKKYRVDFSKLCVPFDQPPPQQAPPLPLERTSSGCAFYAVPMVNAVPSTRFFDMLGFELGLAFTSRHGHADGWEEVGRLVAGHDKPGVDHMIITVGGPNGSGLGFPTEERLMEFLLDAPEPIQTPAHIRQVRVHFWSTGRVVEIVPMVQEVRGSVHPLGFVPAHRK